MTKKTGKSFEEKMNRLQDIVSKLESDSTDLDESIKLYSEGLQISKEMKKELSEFEEKVKALGDSNE